MIHNYLIILTSQHYFITFKYVIMANTLKRSGAIMDLFT